MKILAPDPKYIDVAAFDDVAERFRREGSRGAGLGHNHLVQILAYEENTHGECFHNRAVVNPFIVMEFIRGKTLESAVRNLGQDQVLRVHINRQTLSIARAVSEALKYLHERKIVHRDVKPANIFVSSARAGIVPSECKLGDFGVTKWGDFLAAASTGTLTLSSQRGLGTLKYMSPEQALKPKDVTVRSDIFSLGITLFELFTGRILPSPHHVFEIMRAGNMRASISGKLYALGLRALSPFEEAVLEKVLGMFSGARSRPSSQELLGRFEFWLDRLEPSAEER